MRQDETQQTTGGREPQGLRPVVLITGVSGLIGARTARLLAADYDIVGLDIKPPDPDDLGGAPLDFRETDLTDDRDTAEVLKNVRQVHGPRIASVIHLAAYYDFSGEPSPLYEDLTVEGTRRLLRGLQSFEVGQFVFSSSLLVMEPSPDKRPLSEDSPTRAEWEYPESKLEAERVIREEREDIPAVILRISGVYDDDCRSLPISQQIGRIYEKKPESYVFPGDAETGQAYVHMDDLMDCLKRVVERRRQLDPVEVFLIGEPEVVTYAEMQERVGELIHEKAWPSIRVPKPVAKAGAWAQEKMSSEEDQPFIKPWMVELADDHYAVDITRARQKLGWEPRHFLGDVLPEMVRRLKADPAGWYRLNGLPTPEDFEAGM